MEPRLLGLEPTLLAGAALLAVGCWDEIEHTYDCEVKYGDTDTSTTTADAGDTEQDSGTAAAGQGNRIPGWEGMGAPCQEDKDCKNMPGGRCVFNIVEVINAVGGYCLSCCNTPGVDVCAPGIDCVGVDEVYLICLNRCTSDNQCREAEGYKCLPIWYLDEIFAGNYCLPDADHVQPGPDDVPTDPHCDWPWLPGK